MTTNKDVVMQKEGDTKKSRDIGNMMTVPAGNIRSGAPITASQPDIDAAAEAIRENGGRALLPIPVRQIGSDSYEVIGNANMLAAARRAGVDPWIYISDQVSESEFKSGAKTESKAKSEPKAKATQPREDDTATEPNPKATAKIIRPLDRDNPNIFEQSQKRQAVVDKLYERLAMGRFRTKPDDDDRTRKGKMGALTALSDARNPKVGLVSVQNSKGQYTGFLSYKAGRREVEIETLGTDGTQKGSGRALFEEVLKFAAKENKGIVVSPVADAIGFYERMGMRKVSEGALELSAEEVKDLVKALRAR
jgi:hypothetical protein